MTSIPRKPLWNGRHVIQTNSRSDLITRSSRSTLHLSTHRSPINKKVFFWLY
jgi:hypothetical protein